LTLKDAARVAEMLQQHCLKERVFRWHPTCSARGTADSRLYHTSPTHCDRL